MSLRVFVIGTLHANLTPVDELIGVVSSLEPSMLLVEVVDADLRREMMGQYPPEMRAIAEWGRQEHLIVYGFDCGIHVLRDGKTASDNTSAIDEQVKRMGALTWKDMNTPEHLAVLQEVSRNLVDPDKMADRRERMIENVRDLLPTSGNVVIVTGASHLDVFKAALPDCELPLRN